MAVDGVAEPLAHRLREVVLEVDHEVGVVGRVGLEQVVLEVDLGVGEQHRDLGPHQPARRRLARDQLLVGRQRLERAIEPAFALERADHARVRVDRLAGVVLGDAHRQRLLVVVAQHQRRHVAGHLLEQAVAVLDRELARPAPAR